MVKELLAASVLDAGALIAFEGGDPRIRQALRDRPGSVIVPAPVLAQVWRDGRRQARISRLLAASGTVVEDLDELAAKAVGRVLAQSGTSDIVDGSVVVSARRHQAGVLSSDPDDLERLDPTIVVERI